MEFNCPDCGKRLRSPDHLKNPLVRCRTCGATFRPREKGDTPPPVAIQTASMPVRPPEAESLANPWSTRQTTAGPAASTTLAKGFGVVGFVLLILLAKAPRLVKLFEREAPPPPAPAQVRDDELRAIQQILEEAQRRPPVDPALVQPDEKAPLLIPLPANPLRDEPSEAAPDAVLQAAPDAVPEAAMIRSSDETP